MKCFDEGKHYLVTENNPKYNKNVTFALKKRNVEDN